MTPWDTAAGWVAVRALHEGATPTLRLLSLATNHNEKRMAKRAASEGWEGVTATIGRDRQAQLQKLIAKLDRHIETLIGEADAAAGGFDKVRIDALTALTKTIERLRDMMPGGTAAAEGNARERDAYKAALLQKIQYRLQDLAKHFAAPPGQVDQPG